MAGLGSVKGRVPSPRREAGLQKFSIPRRANLQVCRDRRRPDRPVALPAVSGSPDLVFAHLAAERVAMDAEGLGRPREAAVPSSEHAGDESLLEFPNGVLEVHASLDHFFHELVEPFGNHCSSRPVSRRKTSTYFSRVLITTSSGSEGTGGRLFQPIRSR